MTTITTRSGKGSPLTNNEVDANFTNLNDDKVEASGDSMTGNLSFGDNNKAIFGAGSDLQIYHDGSDSYIDEVGTGNLLINANNLRLRDTSGNPYFLGNSGAEARVYYAGATKLQTTSTGIDVTGTVTADGLTVGTSTITETTNDLTINATDDLFLEANGNRVFQAWDNGSLQYVAITNGSQNLAEFNSNGDISFYEDTGTTAKFFWDASAERLGIGTTSPAATLHLKGSGGCEFHMESGDGASTSVIKHNQSTDALEFYPDGSLAMTLQAGNQAIFESNVGIGTSSPARELEVTGSGNVYVKVTAPTATDSAGLELANTGATWLIQNDDTSNEALTFDRAGTEVMRIDDSGNLLVGNTDTDPATNNVNGVAITAGGEVIASLNGVAAQFNRRTTDGDVAVFKKGGSTKGSIGILSSRLYIGSGDTGIKFSGADDLISPIDASDGTGRDNAIDLGSSSTRFKDIYLSGGTWITGSVPRLQLNDSDGTNTVGEIRQLSDAIVVKARNGTSNGVIKFTGDNGTTESEYARFDSSGNLLVGTTDNTIETSSSGEGVNILPNKISVSRDGGTTANFNRITSDGDIVKFRKDGVVIGHIGTNGGDLTIYSTASQHGGVRFAQAGMLPIDNTGALSDATEDIGQSNQRWKDIYLSGGVYLGGTGSANLLDDYEEGSFAMSLHDAASGGNQSSTSKTAYYTKIGNQVTVYVYAINNIDTTGMTAGNSLYFALPFTAGGVGRAVGSVIHHGFTYDGNSDYEDMKPYVATGSSRGLFATVGYGIADSSVKVSDVSSGVDDIHTLTLTYFVA